MGRFIQCRHQSAIFFAQLTDTVRPHFAASRARCTFRKLPVGACAFSKSNFCPLDANHHAHEGARKRQQARSRISRCHAARRIQNYHRADARNGHAEHPGKSVEAQPAGCFLPPISGSNKAHVQSISASLAMILIASYISGTVCHKIQGAADLQTSAIRSVKPIWTPACVSSVVTCPR